MSSPLLAGFIFLSAPWRSTVARANQVACNAASTTDDLTGTQFGLDDTASFLQYQVHDARRNGQEEKAVKKQNDEHRVHCSSMVPVACEVDTHCAHIPHSHCATIRDSKRSCYCTVGCYDATNGRCSHWSEWLDPVYAGSTRASNFGIGAIGNNHRGAPHPGDTGQGEGIRGGWSASRGGWSAGKHHGRGNKKRNKHWKKHRYGRGTRKRRRSNKPKGELTGSAKKTSDVMHDMLPNMQEGNGQANDWKMDLHRRWVQYFKENDNNTWPDPLMVCADVIKMSGDTKHQPRSMGIYRKTPITRVWYDDPQDRFLPETPFQVHAGRPIYKGDNGMWLYYWGPFKSWRVGRNYTNVSSTVSSRSYYENTWCPEDSERWYVFDKEGNWSFNAGDDYVKWYGPRQDIPLEHNNLTRPIEVTVMEYVDPKIDATLHDDPSYASQWGPDANKPRLDTLAQRERLLTEFIWKPAVQKLIKSVEEKEKEVHDMPKAMKFG